MHYRYDFRFAALTSNYGRRKLFGLDCLVFFFLFITRNCFFVALSFLIYQETAKLLRTLSSEHNCTVEIKADFNYRPEDRPIKDL